MEKELIINNLAQIFEIIANSLRIISTNTKEQLPLFFQEIIKFATMIHIVFLLFGIIIAVISTLIYFIAKKDKWEDGIEWVVSGIG